VQNSLYIEGNKTEQ